MGAIHPGHRQAAHGLFLRHAGPDFTAKHFRSTVEAFFKGAPDGWPCWSFSNHDVIRHVTRWAGRPAPAEDAIARLAVAMLASFEGTICLYQGEELGQTETDILYDELTDPPGFRFWPDYKGRDGCRTPMVWDDSDERRLHGRHALAAGEAAATGPQRRGARGRPDLGAAELPRDAGVPPRTSPALQRGRTRLVDLPEPLLASTARPKPASG